MADSLYVCHFSNGHIKVGRSVWPAARIAAHADRVACMGVELVEQFIVGCDVNSRSGEEFLIDQCAEAATHRFKSEWFAGLDYPTVCAWATRWAKSLEQPKELTFWQILLRDLTRAGLTQMQVSNRCDCHQSSLSDLARGVARDPRYSLGAKLVALRAEVCAPPPKAEPSHSEPAHE